MGGVEGSIRYYYRGVITMGGTHYYGPGIGMILTDYMNQIEINFCDDLHKTYYKVLLRGIKRNWFDTANIYIRSNNSGTINQRLHLYNVLVTETGDNFEVAGDWGLDGKKFRLFAKFLDSLDITFDEDRME